ncbi:hypothetical protein C0J52_25566, partial [Blattella germanica]
SFEHPYLHKKDFPSPFPVRNVTYIEAHHASLNAFNAAQQGYLSASCPSTRKGHSGNEHESILFSDAIQLWFGRRLEFSLEGNWGLIGHLFARTTRAIFVREQWYQPLVFIFCHCQSSSKQAAYVKPRKLWKGVNPSIPLREREGLNGRKSLVETRRNAAVKEIFENVVLPNYSSMSLYIFGTALLEWSGRTQLLPTLQYSQLNVSIKFLSVLYLASPLILDLVLCLDFVKELNEVIYCIWVLPQDGREMIKEIETNIFCYLTKLLQILGFAAGLSHITSTKEPLNYTIIFKRNEPVLHNVIKLLERVAHLQKAYTSFDTRLIAAVDMNSYM